jgi:hypothetical protein
MAEACEAFFSARALRSLAPLRRTPPLYTEADLSYNASSI